MALPLVLVVGAAVGAKVASVGWLASIATSPVAVGSRHRFIEHTDEALENLQSLSDSGYTPEKLAEVRKDVDLLRAHVRGGWSTTKLFGAAMRVSSFKTWAHAKGAVGGTLRLGSNAASAAKNAAADALKSADNAASAAFDWAFNLFEPRNSSEHPF